ncbi:hypothetical protein J3R82DRAFT_3354 [Butyriboletus roseoflavus]|nr:hypothetical protein J3R82DRAFT_3354 [Butyriboletus roseoflavus]
MSCMRKCTAMGPVIHHGFMFINIAVIDMYIWVCTTKDPIDMAEFNSSLQAFVHSMLYPSLNMENVDEKMELALRQIQDLDVSYIDAACNYIAPLVATSNASHSPAPEPEATYSHVTTTPATSDSTLESEAESETSLDYHIYSKSEFLQAMQQYNV